jgi:hypothetical protein
MALWPVIVFLTAEDVDEDRSNICERRAKFKKLNTRVPILSLQLLYVLELAIYL